MSGSRILQGKHAAVFGAGGTIGTAVAKEFVAEGAEVFLSGRTRSAVEAVTKQIIANGGTAHAAVLIASDRARMLTGTVVNATAGAALD